MFIPCTDTSIRYTGRFAMHNDAMTTTAAGSQIDFAFEGRVLVIEFDITDCVFPFPHVYVQIDGGVKAETQIDRWVRFEMPGDGYHTAKIIYKGGKEILNRWYEPLQGKVALLGYSADASAELAPDNRKTIELVGDSITEGVLVDDLRYYPADQDNRIFEDDATGTYGWLTAEALGLRHYHMGYGATGTTRAGCGAVPKCADAYPYCFDGAPVTYGHPDFIMINHGANDRGAPVEKYIAEYRALLELVRTTHPDAKIICLTAFCGCHPDAVKEMVDGFNADHGDDVYFVDATLWVPLEPLHPLRDGHKIVADRLTPMLQERFGL